MKFTVRRTKNLAECLRIHNLVLGDCAFDWTESSVFWLVSDESGKNIGYCSLRAATNKPETAYFSAAGLIPDVRGKGLHLRMIRVRIAFARKMQFKYVQTYTAVDNIASSRHLVNMGFNLVPGPASDSGYWLHFKKEL